MGLFAGDGRGELRARVISSGRSIVLFHYVWSILTNVRVTSWGRGMVRNALILEMLGYG